MPREGQELEKYLAKIRKTIAESNNLVEQARLRMVETDRLLASRGLTREQVMNFKFTPEQRAAVNRELVRNGLEPLEDRLDGVAAGQSDGHAPTNRSNHQTIKPSNYQTNFGDAADAGDEVATRQKKFGMMMKPFMI